MAPSRGLAETPHNCPMHLGYKYAIFLTLQEMFAKHVDGDQLISVLEAEREFVMTPKMFMHTINRICLQQVSSGYLWIWINKDATK